jgi:hypothetical protein
MELGLLGSGRRNRFCSGDMCGRPSDLDLRRWTALSVRELMGRLFERTLMPPRGGVNRRDDQIKPFPPPKSLSFTGKGG